jgi:hypothetical protein
MVTPLDAPMEVLPLGITTRITLSLTTDARLEYQKLLDAIADIPETTIFFLRRLKLISFDTTDLNAQRKKTTIKKVAMKNPRRVKIARMQESSGTIDSDVSLYHHVSETISSMPKDDRRKGITHVKLDLAFPIDPVTMRPKLCELGHHVFAYLPLQRLPQLQVSPPCLEQRLKPNVSL